ncbi:hypothetical protein IWX65_000806 [Arthrobacter sp. CAN_A214]
MPERATSHAFEGPNGVSSGNTPVISNAGAERRQVRHTRDWPTARRHTAELTGSFLPSFGAERCNDGFHGAFGRQ